MIYRRNPLLMTVMGANPGRRRVRRPDEALDQAISTAWHRLMSGVQVPVLDIPRIFRDVKLEIASGTPLEQAVLSVGSRYRVNPGRYRRNPIGEALLGGVAGALVNRALQHNPGPSFIVLDASTGRVVYTKRATGVGNEAIEKCVKVAERMARQFGRSFIVYLDLMGVRVGMEMNVAWARHLGITAEVFPDGSQTHGNPLDPRETAEIMRRASQLTAQGERVREPWVRGYYQGSGEQAKFLATTYGPLKGRGGQAMLRNPAIRDEWNHLSGRKRLAVLEFAGIPEDQAGRLASRPWATLPPHVQAEVAAGWRDSSSRGTTTVRRQLQPSPNPGPRGKRRLTMTIERFAAWVKSKRDPAMWKAFLAKFKGYEKWTHGARARKVTLEWVDTPGVNGLWITYDGGKQPESTYIMPKGAPRKGAWKHPWDTMPDIKHDPEAKIVITKLRGSSKISDFYHK